MAQAILLKDVADLGEAGDAVDVSPGYLRNYLQPRKLALPATQRSLEEAQRRREAAERAAQEAADRAEQTAALLAKTVLTIQHRAGEDGKLYGSVTSAEIADAIADARGLQGRAQEDPPRRADPRDRHLHGRGRARRGRDRLREDDRRRGQVAPSVRGAVRASRILRRSAVPSTRTAP